jgi:hypothetical protein
MPRQSRLLPPRNSSGATLNFTETSHVICAREAFTNYSFSPLQLVSEILKPAKGQIHLLLWF